MRRRQSAAPARLGWDERLTTGAVVVLLFAGHGLYGADSWSLALRLTAGAGLLLVAIALQGWSGEAVARTARASVLPLSLFGLTLLLVAPIPGLADLGRPDWVRLDTSAALLETLKLLGLAAFAAIGCLIAARDQRARLTLELLLAAALLYDVYAVVAFRLFPHTVVASQKVQFLDRLTGTFYSPNVAATFLGMNAVLATGAVLDRLKPAFDPAFNRSRVRPESAWFPMLVLAATLFTCVLTASRAGIAATIAAVAILGLMEAGARRWSLGKGLLVVAPLVVIVLAGVVISGSPVAARMAHLSSSDRTPLYKLSWEAFLRSPLRGWGLGSFDHVNMSALTPQTYIFAWNARSAHNIELQWLEEAGALGALAMFATVLSLMGAALMGVVRRRRMTTWLRTLLAASLLVILHSQTDFALQNPSVAAQWAVLLGLGLGLSVPRSKGSSRRTRDET